MRIEQFVGADSVCGANRRSWSILMHTVSGTSSIMDQSPGTPPKATFRQERRERPGTAAPSSGSPGDPTASLVIVRPPLCGAGAAAALSARDCDGRSWAWVCEWNGMESDRNGPDNGMHALE